MPISTLVSDRAIRIRSEASLSEVAVAMNEADIGLLVLGSDGEPAEAVVSERDLVRALAEGRDPDVTTAREIAHLELAWCDAGATVTEVAAEMMENYVRHVLVEEDGRLVGIVSVRDLLGAYVAADLSAI